MAPVEAPRPRAGAVVAGKLLVFGSRVPVPYGLTGLLVGSESDGETIAWRGIGWIFEGLAIRAGA